MDCLPRHLAHPTHMSISLKFKEDPFLLYLCLLPIPSTGPQTLTSTLPTPKPHFSSGAASGVQSHQVLL